EQSRSAIVGSRQSQGSFSQTLLALTRSEGHRGKRGDLAVSCICSTPQACRFKSSPVRGSGSAGEESPSSRDAEGSRRRPQAAETVDHRDQSASRAPQRMSATTVDQRPKGQGNKVQNGSMHQKDAVNDDDFEPYLSGQTNQERNRNK
uniref:YTH N6-methyladenosine RNA binding protein F3 n=1 Tax=Paramormyrops kingsleyae TaxID=1676925 RepID=A0A3B3S3V1_9TELE